MGIILKPFAWLLLFLYQTFNSYGLALILFGIIVKTVLFPVALKSKKSMIQTSMLSGKMQQLKNQYGKNPERYNQEVQKLYERENVNPMGGCLWSLIPMAVLIGLFYIIRQPMTNFMDLTLAQIQTIADALDWKTVAVANGWESAKNMNILLEKLAAGDITSVFRNGTYNQVYLASLINADNLETLKALVPGAKLMPINFSFLGLDLSAIPTWKFWQNGISLASIGMFILPLVSVVVSFLSMKVSLATNKMNKNDSNAQVDQTNKMMLWMMPVMSLLIGFSVPAGLSIYWITQYLVTMVQDLICSKMLKKDYEAARAAAEERERQEKEEEKRRREEARAERARRIEAEKQNKGKKKAVKSDDPDQEEIRKSDSREGMRTYARGRAYIPNRFGGVTEYVDPNIAINEENAAKAKKKGDKKAEDETKEGV